MVLEWGDLEDGRLVGGNKKNLLTDIRRPERGLARELAFAFAASPFRPPP